LTEPEKLKQTPTIFESNSAVECCSVKANVTGSIPVSQANLMSKKSYDKLRKEIADATGLWNAEEQKELKDWCEWSMARKLIERGKLNPFSEDGKV
jgi:hypothetical protein